MHFASLTATGAALHRGQAAASAHEAEAARQIIASAE